MKGLGQTWKWENRYFLFILAVALCVFSYHLGLMPLLDDEPTRALVSLEMVLSGNYVVPTTHGELYQNKPPLFNWFIAGLMHIAPHFDELWLRVPSMLAVLATAVVAFLFFKKELSAKTGLVTALAYLTCGRILFYDSMLGYIDPFFTLILFLDFILLYRLAKGENHIWIFLSAYFLCLLAYLLKGLPALVFHFFTLAISLYLSKQLPLLFSWKNVVGGLFMLVGLGIYYYNYSQEQELGKLFSTLWEQSSSRTAAEFSLWHNVQYAISFPFEFVMHFLPWSLLVFVFFFPASIRHIRQNQCLTFCAFVFLGNIWVYWISPETRPRYLFIFLPLFFAVAVDSFYHIVSSRAVSVAYRVSFGLALACAVAVWAPLFFPIFREVQMSLVVCVLSSVVILLLADLMYKRPWANLPLFAIVLLAVRLVFNHFVLPARKAEAPESTYKAIGMKIGDITKTSPVYLLENTLIDHDLAYYISSTNKKVVGYTFDSVRDGVYYICSPEIMNRYGLVSELEFKTNFQNATLFLARKK